MKAFRWLSCLLIIIAFFGSFSFLYWYLSPHYPEFVESRTAVFNDRKVNLFVIDLTEAGYTFELKNDSEHPLTIKSWREKLGSDIVFNAAYFDEDNTPVGYLKAGNTESVIPWPTEAIQKKPASYTFFVGFNEGKIELSYLPEHPLSEPSVNGFLSFPTLVANGEAIIKEDSEQHTARTVLAKGENGHIYLVLTDSGVLSLYEAAEWLADQKENFTLAGNLDGGPSTGLSLENGAFDLEDPSDYVPSIISGFATQ